MSSRWNSQALLDVISFFQHFNIHGLYFISSPSRSSEKYQAWFDRRVDFKAIDIDLKSHMFPTIVFYKLFKDLS